MTRSGVALGYVCGDTVRPVFMRSVLAAADRGQLREVIDVEGLYVPANRNQVVDQFLERDNSEWLWFVDADMQFGLDALPRLLDAAGDERKIIAGAYWAGSFDGTRSLSWIRRRDDGDLWRIAAVQSSGLYPLDACGMGCTLIHRDVFEAILAQRGHDDPWVWFGHDLHRTSDGMSRAGEDVTFCLRALTAGFQTWGLADLMLDHHKVGDVPKGDTLKPGG